MKSKAPRKKLLSDFSSQDETSMKRSLKADLSLKRNRKPSIYDSLDDEELVNEFDEEEYDSYFGDDDDGYAEGDDDWLLIQIAKSFREERLFCFLLPNPIWEVVNCTMLFLYWNGYNNRSTNFLALSKKTPPVCIMT